MTEKRRLKPLHELRGLSSSGISIDVLVVYQSWKFDAFQVDIIVSPRKHETRRGCDFRRTTSKLFTDYQPLVFYTIITILLISPGSQQSSQFE